MLPQKSVLQLEQDKQWLLNFCHLWGKVGPMSEDTTAFDCIVSLIKNGTILFRLVTIDSVSIKILQGQTRWELLEF